MARNEAREQSRAVTVVELPADLQPMAGKADVRGEVMSLRAQVEAVLPSRVDPDRFLRVAASAIMGNPKLMECTRVSLLVALHEAAQLGLEPTGLLGSAYLVPYRRKVQVPHPSNPNATVDRFVMEAKLIPGYRGLIDLARRSGEILAISANVVRLRDTFRIVQGSSPDIIHEPYIPDPREKVEERDPGPYIGAYMVAVLSGGWKQTEWMTYDQIEAVRRSSKAADHGPWVENWPEMARKTVVRRGAKYLPLTTEFRRALELDEEAERMASAPSAPPLPANPALAFLEARTLGREGADDAGVGPESTPDPSVAPDPVSGGLEGNGEPTCAVCRMGADILEHQPSYDGAGAHPFEP